MKKQQDLPRVFVTGRGAFVPEGKDISHFWKSLLPGKSFVRRISSFDPSLFPTQIAVEISNFDSKKYFEPKEARRTERYTQFALIASRQAASDAGFSTEKGEQNSFGVYEGSSLGPTGWFLDQHAIFLEKGYRRANPLTLAIGFPGAASAKLASFLNTNGPSYAITGGSVAASLALAAAFATLRAGELDSAIVVGSEAPVHPAILAAFSTVNAMSKRNDDPPSACRPFDANRDGFVLGEGAAAVVLETEDSLMRRGGRPYAELKSVGTSCDNYHITAPDPTGHQIAEAMRSALRKANLTPDMIDHFNAHGTATKLNDQVEAIALRKVFGIYTNALPVTSIKGTVGHALGACGLIEVVASILMLENQTILPTANVSKLDDDCRLNVISDKPIAAPLDHVMTNNYSFGGKNTSIILSRPSSFRTLSR